MIFRGAQLTSRVAIFFACLFAVTACGGGGGGGGSFFDGDAGSSTQLAVTLLDPQGNETDNITSASPGTVKVTVKGGASGVVVNASTDLGILSPPSGTALTNDSGVATFQLAAGAGKGGGTVSATATDGGATLTGSKNFQVGESGLRLGYFDADGSFIENVIAVTPEAALSAGGNAQLSVVILDKDGERVTTVEDVRFSSGCIAGGQSTTSPSPASSVNGEASALYTAAGCSGSDTVTASLDGASASASATLSIAAAATNSVNFVSAAPSTIVLKGTGGSNRSETSEVVFQVADGGGGPMQGVSVEFALNTEVGGLSLSKSSALSDGEGLVRVTVQSGDVATVARVTASVDDGRGDPVSTVSDLLTVTTGLPDQNSISLAVSGTFVIENGFITDGINRTLTVSMADKFNNPVVDDTAAIFTTEYGAIVGSCTTVDGTCEVPWRTQEPRFPTLTGDDNVVTIFDSGYSCPSHNGSSGPCPDDLGYTRGGRSTILVHAIGEESFVDRNGNGILDEAEKDLFDNLPEAFIDNNEDGVYTPGLPECEAAPMGSAQCAAGAEEIYVDFNNNQVYDRNDSPAVYNGLLCPPEGDGVWCSRDLVHVRDQIVLPLSAGPRWDMIMVRGGSEVTTTSNGASQIVYIADIYNTRPPGGSTVSVAVEGDCELLSDTSFTVPNTSAPGAYSINVVTGPPASGDGTPGVVKVGLSPTAGEIYSVTYNCEAFVPPTDPDPEEGGGGGSGIGFG
jgi:hypothetical protein